MHGLTSLCYAFMPQIIAINREGTMNGLAMIGLGLLPLILGIVAGTAVFEMRRGASHKLVSLGLLGLVIVVLCCSVGWYLRQGAEDYSLLFSALEFIAPIGFLVGLTTDGAGADLLSRNGGS